ncbi:MAG: acetyl-CoA carboxylase biotin carboxyl carrier protein [Alphaproteobacteria bacterium]
MKRDNIDQDLVRDLAKLLAETGLTELEIESDGFRIRVSRTVAAVAQVAQAVQVGNPTPPASPGAADTSPSGSLDDHPGAVRAPMVGTAYILPEPGAAPFVKVGDTIREGQILLLIEAMKTFNEIRAPKAGRVARVLIENGTPVEYGEALMIIE